MSGTDGHFEGQLVEYTWGGCRWKAAAIARGDATDVWIISTEAGKDQARYAFAMPADSDCSIDGAMIAANDGAVDAMFELADEYLLDIVEDDLDEDDLLDGKEAQDEVFRFELGPLSLKASVAKAS